MKIRVNTHITQKPMFVFYAIWTMDAVFFPAVNVAIDFLHCIG